MRIVLIGGGSYSWGPVFLRDIVITPALRGSTVVLHDVDAERLDLVHRLGRKMLSDFAPGYQLEATLSLDEALTGADLVILSITTGGLEAMRADLEIPARYGIRQSVGDTVGPGGLARALRNIPVVEAIGRRVMAICPNALFLNYTNPLTVLTRTLALTGVRVLGLCHEWHGVREKLAGFFGVAPAQIVARVAGINHLIWVTGLWAGGRDVWPELPRLARLALADEIVLDADDDSVFADRGKVKARLLQLYGALPAAGDRHVAEFFSGFLTAETAWGADYGLRLTGIADREAMESDTREKIEAVLSGEASLAPFMAAPSGEAAAEIAAALVENGHYIGIMNLPNIGQISDLPRDVVVETYGVVTTAGPQPLAFGAFPPGVRAVLMRHVLNQELTVQAALTGDPATALQVLLHDPLCARLSVEQTGAMLGELLDANRSWLERAFAHVGQQAIESNILPTVKEN